MWWDDKIYLLDLGMAGEVDAGTRESLLLLLLAFWQEDTEFLADRRVFRARCSGRSSAPSCPPRSSSSNGASARQSAAATEQTTEPLPTAQQSPGQPITALIPAARTGGVPEAATALYLRCRMPSNGCGSPRPPVRT
jgi:hypothetical protein